MYNILIVDDEIEIVKFVEIYLKNDGYNVFKAFNIRDTFDIIKKEKVDLIILDIMMPDINGLKGCAEIRKEYSIPIIMLSAKSQDVDKIQGLSTGADDYMTKPFNPMELLARVKAQIRRYTYLNEFIKDENFGKEKVEVNGLIINNKNYKAYLYGKELKLTPIEHKILWLLASNKGKVFSSEEIFEKVWKEKYFTGNNTVMAHIWRLREKIEENPKQPKILKTVWGVGYKIEE